MRHRATRLIGAGLGLAALVFAWLYFAPRELGGSTTYAIVVGSSMEPGIERGDLVVARAAPRYEVGDVAAYTSTNLRAIVLHRIVARSGNRFVFKGDNNDFRDPERPAQGALLGKMWFQVPVAGTVLERLRSPRNIAILAAAAALLVAAGGVGVRRRRRGRPALEHRPDPRLPAAGLRRYAQAALVFLGVVAVAFGALGLLALTRSTSRALPRGELYRQSGAFGYTAVAPASPIYDGTSLRTGDALFLALVRRVTLTFDYRFESRLAHRVSGTVALQAELSDGNGWRRTLELAPPRPFAGDSVLARGELDLAKLDRLVQRFQAITGTTHDAYLVTIRPRVVVAGTVAGRSLGERFDPAVVFALDSSRFRLAPDLVLGGKGNDLTPIRSAPAPPRAERASLSLPGVRLDVRTARLVGVAVALAALAGLAGVAGLLALGARGGDEPARIRDRYGALLVPVAWTRRPRVETVVAVASMEALVSLAERYDRAVLHEEASGVHTYVVEEAGTVYRYEAQDGRPVAESARPPLQRPVVEA